MDRRTGRGFLVGAAVFVVALVVLVFVVPGEYAWFGTLVALVIAVFAGRAAANPAEEPARPYEPPRQ